MIRWSFGVRRTGPRTRTPITVINVKPYHVIMWGIKIYCDEESGSPLVFDTFDLAELCVKNDGLTGCEIKKMELEELVHKCRDRAIPFDRFILIDNPAQLPLVWVA